MLTVGASSADTLSNIAATFDTPLYVYDLDRLGARIRELRAATSKAGAELYFATMANDRPRVLAEIAAAGVGACVNSVSHLALALDNGFAAANTQFTSTGVTTRDMARLRAGGIRVNLDSIGQLRQWFGLGGDEAGLRLNAAALTGSARGDRIGVASAEIARAIELARGSHARVNGVHVYVGTNFGDYRKMLPTLRAFFEAAAQFPDLEYVNVGGGVGVNYGHVGPDFDLGAFGCELASLADQLRANVRRPVRLFFEPGRSLAADCAVMLATVTDVKTLGGRRFAAVDASVAVFPRPLLHPESPHRISILGKDVGGGDRRSTIVGRTTFSRDILGTLASARDVERGDVLVFDDAGAYCQSMASRFLGQEPPFESYVGGTVANV